MGNVSGMYHTYYKSPEVMPNFREGPTFDPLYGFPQGRKERVMVATEDEMEAAGLTAEQRDYCAHTYIDFLKCRRQKFPYVAACKPQLHVHEECEYQDYVLRMKEYERERRLLERRKRKGSSEGSSETMKE